MKKLLCLILTCFCGWVNNVDASANRFTNLDESEPFYPSLAFPKLTTPQWIGETNVEAVVILAIDDMRDPARYETWLRPVLTRLKQIDGRAPLSIFANSIAVTNAQLQTWLKEGLSIEVHTLTHPCPFFAQSNFVTSAETYYGCLDLLSRIPNGAPVAFRMPCCDSINSPSPRFYAELFNRPSPARNFLQIDSSVMNILSAQDPALPRELVMDADGKDRFHKYLPFPSFTTTIENYPYPYVIGKLCWEFPPAVPSDWEAQHIHGATNSVTVSDWKAALDATVLKQGTFTFIFHPHGWIRPDQIVEFVDYAAEHYGPKVKFLNFREALERLNKNLLAGESLRDSSGNDNGVRLADLNNDGFLDVVIANHHLKKTRIWEPTTHYWRESDFPITLVEGAAERGAHFGVLRDDAVEAPFFLQRDESSFAAWRFDGRSWLEEPRLLVGLESKGQPIFTKRAGLDQGVRLRDVNNDGNTELIIANSKQSAVFNWDTGAKRWQELSYVFPSGAAVVDDAGHDNGLRFVDFNGDGFADIIQSNEKNFLLNLFVPEQFLGFQQGWSRAVMEGKRGDRGELPMIIRGGEYPNNGAWFHSGQMWVQNEDTALLPDIVDRRSYSQLLAGLQPQPLSPDQALKSFQVAPGFTIDLVASEPLVKDPISFEWGADGKLWVVEMGDYPLGMDGKGKPGGTVLYLEDTNGDGKYDKSTIFLENLNFPTGIFPWGKGVVVSASPEIFYAEDTDGDGKADVRRTLFTGFHPGNQQHRLNGFDYGLDNLLYGANGESGGDVEPNLDAFALLSTKALTHLRGHDFRFNPDRLFGGLFEAVAGTTQYGRHRDDWGNWFGNNNPSWLWHYYADEKYFRRNPDLPTPSLKHYLADYHDGTRVFPISQTIQRFNDIGMVNHVTSGNSAMPYRDALFGPDFASSIFISEPVHNVVHREVLENDGVTFTSHRAKGEETREFLASSDNWFRPTMLKTGPDGALYIADMYRLVLEHPEWIPADTQKSLDLRAGADKGRIYRVYPTGAKLRPIPRLDKLSAPELVQALDSVNGWQRDTAQRLLVQVQDSSSIPALAKLARESDNPKTRLQALATLHGLNKQTPEVFTAAFSDQEPHVRAFAVKLAERSLDDSAEPWKALLNRVLELAGDDDIRVRYQVAFSLGETSDPRAAKALLKIGRRDPKNDQIRLAMLSSALPHLPGLLDEMIQNLSLGSGDRKLFQALAGMALSRTNTVKLAPLLEKVSTLPSPRAQYVALAAFSEALAANNSSFARLKQKGGPDLEAAISVLEPAIQRARTVLTDPHTDLAMRESLLPVLAGLNSDSDIQTAVQIFCHAPEESLRNEARRLLSAASNPKIGAELIRSWKNIEPSARPAIIALLSSRESSAAQLLDEIDHGVISSGEIGRPEQQKLLNNRNERIRERAVSIFGTPNKDRQKVLQEYATVSLLKPDPAHGAELFRANCTQCHRLKEQGTQVGPDLTIVQEKSTEALIESILDPNRAFEAPYVSYTLLTHDGQEFSGLIANESENSVTLRAPNVSDKMILRKDIVSLRSSGISLMPEGFEKALTPQALADLITYIRAK